jgi:hypothetical protein
MPTQSEFNRTLAVIDDEIAKWQGVKEAMLRARDIARNGAGVKAPKRPRKAKARTQSDAVPEA